MPHSYETSEEIQWCPGCGNFPIRKAIIDALTHLDISPSRLVISTGIGQAPKMCHYVKCNGLDGIHGRSLPAVLGAYLANPSLTYISIDGDGGAYAEGTSHFIHSLRRNPNVLYLVHNNKVFGLTKGQSSPTSSPDFVSKMSLHGTLMPEFNPLGVAIANNGTFVARGSATDLPHLTDLIKAGIQHQGFAFVDILQPCVSYNHTNTYQWYKERVYHLEEQADYNPEDRMWAFKKTMEWGKKIPIGIFYKSHRAPFHFQYPVLAEAPLNQFKTPDEKVKDLLEEYY